MTDRISLDFNLGLVDSLAAWLFPTPTAAEIKAARQAELRELEAGL